MTCRVDTIQVDDCGWGEVYVRVICADGEYGDDITFTSRAEAEREAERLSRRHKCSWECNYP